MLLKKLMEHLLDRLTATRKRAGDIPCSCPCGQCPCSCCECE